MTETWDSVQEFLGYLSELDDPSLFKTGIQMVVDLVSSIHDIDHRLDQRIARAVDITGAMKRIREFNQAVRDRRLQRVPVHLGQKEGEEGKEASK